MTGGLAEWAYAAVADTATLLLFGGATNLRDDSLLGILLLELLLLVATWGCVAAYCRHRRAILVELARRADPRLRVSPFLSLLDDHRFAALYDQTLPNRWQYTLGRWLSLACSAMITYSLYQPSLSRYLPFVAELGRRCPNEACTVSCRIGRKLHVGKSAIFLLVQLYASGVRHGRRAENAINTALRSLIWLPFLAAKWTTTCWVGRDLQILKASPLLNAGKGLLTLLGMEMFLPTGAAEALSQLLATSLSLSVLLCWMPWPDIFIRRSDPPFVFAVAVFPILLLACPIYVIAYRRESRQLDAFLRRRLSTVRRRD